MLMLLHPNPAPMKHHALGLQPEALFQPVRAGQSNFSTGSQHAMPRQTR